MLLRFTLIIILTKSYNNISHVYFYLRPQINDTTTPNTEHPAPEPYLIPRTLVLVLAVLAHARLHISPSIYARA